MPKFLALIAGIVAIYLGVINIFKISPAKIAIPVPSPNPLSIEYLRQKSFPGSDVKIEETLPDGSNYSRYIVSYISDGLKVYSLLTIPKTSKPARGFPAIIFNHGYITPEKYTPDGNYIAYVDALAKAGYVIFKPDYRGNGKSDGSPGSEYFSQNYVIDDLNAIASIKKFKEVDPTKIGVWGHSLGGNLTLKVAVIPADIKAAVIWGGVVGSINDIIYNWQNRVSYKPNAEDLYLRNKGLAALLATYGTPAQNPSFWNSIDPINFISDVKIPIQIHVGASDPQVPTDFSKNLYQKLTSLGKTTEFYEYPGANHDIQQGFSLAMQRTIDFFNKYLK